MRDAIKLAEGSVQDIDELPDELRAIYRTAWEIPMRVARSTWPPTAAPSSTRASR